MASCQYSVAIGSEDVEFWKIQSRICEECVREIFYELKKEEVDEVLQDVEKREDKQNQMSSAPEETRIPSIIISSTRPENLKSIADMERDNMQDSPKKQTKGQGSTTETGKLSGAENSRLPNLQPSSVSESEGVKEQELRRSPRKK